VKRAKRKAREERLSQDYQALEDFANLGDTLDDLRKFRLEQPTFFPDYLAEWIYRSTENWMILSTLPDTPDEQLKETLRRRFNLNPDDCENWPEMAQLYRADGIDIPPLLFYRDLLRAIWRREDPDGSCLKYLLGFEEGKLPDVEGGKELWLFGLPPEPAPEPFMTYRIKEKQVTQYAGLPCGTPVVDSSTGVISWSFGCPFQRAVYDLMQERWRAMVCPECGKYFIAYKTAQKYCSTKCTGERKQKKALEYYHNRGRAARQEKTLRAKSQKREIGPARRHRAS
jgi:hypothetical protein